MYRSIYLSIYLSIYSDLPVTTLFCPCRNLSTSRLKAYPPLLNHSRAKTCPPERHIFIANILVRILLTHWDDWVEWPRAMGV